MLQDRCPIRDRAAALASCGLAVTLVAFAAPAAADPDEHASSVQPRPPSQEPVVPNPSPVEKEPTAADVASAPLPGTEHGRTDPIDRGDSSARRIGRGILFVPKLAVDLALLPARGAIYASDRYSVADRYRRTFFNDEMTIGLYPTVVIDSSFGIFAGGRFVHKDLFGQREQLTLQAAWGNRFRQIYSATFRSGELFGDRFRLELDTAYERRPHDAFYGIGNGDEIAAPEMPVDPIDPRIDARSVETRFRQDRGRVAAVVDTRVASHLHLRPAAAWSQTKFGPGDEGRSIDEVYDPAALPGRRGVRYAYTELGLRWDNRSGGRSMEPESVFSKGSLLDLYGGRTHRLDDGPDFWRYGLDAQHFLRLGEGPRVLVLRLHGEAVTGGRDEVPFTELPMLGGPTYLRGYNLDRFRDRVAAFGSVQYQWDLSQWISASTFVDVGRVYPSLSELSLDDMRLGYGVGIEGHTVKSFVAEATLASSIDGGVILNLSFNRVFDLEERVRRK